MSDLFDSPVGRVFAASPPEISRILRRYLDEELLPLANLRDQIAAYLENLRQLSLEHEFIDLELATTIAARFHELLDEVTAETSSEKRRLIQAAAKYFMLEQDADGDTTSPIGFDDDTLVFNLVAREMGRDDLVIEGF